MIQFAVENRFSPKIAKVYLDGEDITKVCTAFNRDLGIATVIERDGRKVRRRKRRGKIRTLTDYELEPTEVIHLPPPWSRDGGQAGV